jgi:uncharacterized repeat protein (TIGR02543 family)
MNKRFQRIVLSLACCFCALSAPSCSDFVSDESLSISSITAQTLDNGVTELTFTFDDSDEDPLVIDIPKGDKGDTGAVGNGISDVTCALSEDGKSYVITVTYTDSSKSPDVFTIPVPVEVSGVSTTYDTTSGQTTVTITLSDGTTQSFVVSDGVGISSITQSTDDDGNTILTINYTDPTKTPSTITIPYVSGKDGKDGVGIASMYGYESDGKYYIQVTYTDGTTQTLPFAAPDAGIKWYSGSSTSDITETPSEGDFFYCFTDNSIYTYQDGMWVLVVVLKDNSVYTVTFDAATNGGSLVGGTTTVKVSSGKTISSLPTAYKAGATFIGWYTSSAGPESPNSGHFTDLTPVTSDLTLYACFE